MQNSLIKRLIEKLKANNFEFSKKVASMALAGTMALSSLGLSACKNENNTNNPGTSTSQPNTGDNGNSSGSTTQKPDYSKYSQILQTVLTDNYYQGLIGTDLSYSSGTYAYNNQSFQAIPYGFLEDEGFNVKDIKNGNLETTADLYSIDNNLYIELKTEIQSTKNYFANYVLRYSLTNQEMKEIKALFANLSPNKKITYFQAPFFVQELSYQKDPEVVSVAYITKESLESITEFFNNEKLLTSYHLSIYLGSEYVTENIAYHMFNLRPRIISSQANSRVGTITIASIGYDKFVNGNHIVSDNTKYQTAGILTSENSKLFEDSVTAIVAYSTTDYCFKDLSTSNELESLLK